MGIFNDILDSEKKAFFVDSHKIEHLIEQIYEMDEYSIVASEELGNYQRYEMWVDGDIDEDDAASIKARKQMYMTRRYLNDLGRRDIIPRGLYVIDTSW